MSKLQLQSAKMAGAVRASNSSKFDGWSHEQLVAEIERLRKRKKYGLVWEEKPEDVVERCKTELPVLKEVEGKAIAKDANAPTNVLIEGDNYHALSVLNYTHKGKIDLVYIDPPYNTGARDWRYNNDYVDINDGYRHSKWLSMMQARLLLAKNLLKRQGVLVCTIDHNEQERLGLLLEEIFPSKKITCVTIVHNPAGVQGDNFSYTHEYAYFVYPSEGRSIGYQVREEGDEDVRNFRDVTGAESLRTAAANCFYPILVKGGKIIGFGDVSEDGFHPKAINIKGKDGVIEIYPVDPQGVERKWRFARQTVESVVEELTVKHIRARDVYDIVRTKNWFNYKTVWTDSKYSANNHGTQLLNKIIKAGSFSYPKSLHAVIDCLAAASNGKKDFLALDFFAGSGTTGHAVLALNKEDGGNRRFILCNNNENNIASEVCYPRISKVIKGYKNAKGEAVEGLGSNFRYFRTAFVGAEPNDKNKESLTRQATEMLCLREDTFEPVKTTSKMQIFKHGTHYTGIVFDESAIPALKKDIAKMDGVWSVYVFSLGDDTFDEEFADMEQTITVSPIPEVILRVYRRLFKH